MSSNHRFIGNQAEDLACQYLERLDYQILERNFTIVGGEIDIIAIKDQVLIFIEVKARYSHEYGLPEESINVQKIEALTRAIRLFVHMHKLWHLSCRIDLLAIDFTLSKDRPKINLIENITEDYC